jgi:glycosyltransferase involved in cell wall biosynthesis
VSYVPTVSVVIPFFNNIEHLGEAVQSVIAQTVSDWELILVDDGSTDGSSTLAVELAAGDDRIRYVEHAGHRNLGHSAARNAGIGVASGEFVALLDADDAYLPAKLERELAAFRRAPDAGLVFAPAIYVHADGRRNRQRMTLPAGLIPRGHLVPAMLRREDDAPCTGAAMFRRSVALATGGFNEDFRVVYGDQVMWCKLAFAAPVYYDPEPSALYRIHDSSVCRSSSELQRRRARVEFCAWLHEYSKVAAPSAQIAVITQVHLLEAAVGFTVISRDAAATGGGRGVSSPPPLDGLHRLLRPVVGAASIFPLSARVLARASVLLAHAGATLLQAGK